MDLKVTDLFIGEIELASPPDLYFKLNRIMQSATHSMEDAGRIIEKDPNLCVKLLKIVNSAYYGFPAQITTISRAITMVGLAELNNMVLGTLVLEKFSDLPGGLMSMQDYWQMSLHTALMSDRFGRKMEFFQADSNQNYAESMFICGLLHEIGLLVFYRKIPELARDVGMQLASIGSDEVQAELHLIGFDHYQAGAELVKIWNLPYIIETTIRHHQYPAEAGEFFHASAAIKFASQVSRSLYREGYQGSKPDLSLLPLDATDVQDIIDDSAETLEEILQIFISG